MKILIISLSLFLCAFAPPSIQTNNEGVTDFEQENYDGAFTKFAEALSKDPNNPIMHFNLANAFYKKGELKKAFTEFEAVESAPHNDAEIKFKAMFNAGNMAVEAKDLPSAMKYYQKALQYKPDSKEVKTNIELALRDPQGGGGGGENQNKNQDQNQNKDQNQKKEQDQNKDQKDQNKQPNKDDKRGQKPQPKPFESKDLNESDVRRILEELKRQENEIRSKNQKKNKSAEEPPSGKDW